jgi:alkylation response protein AidB-like acyl-CoA dehydrogenase
VTARTSGDHGTRGITSFILTKDTCDLRSAGRWRRPRGRPAKTKGFRPGKKEDKTAGARATPASSSSRRHRSQGECPRHGGRGFVNFLKTLDGAHRHRRALPWHRGRRVREARKYAGTRKQFGRYIVSFRACLRPSDMATGNEADPPSLHGRPAHAGRPFLAEGGGNG